MTYPMGGMGGIGFTAFFCCYTPTTIPNLRPAIIVRAVMIAFLSSTVYALSGRAACAHAGHTIII